MSAPAESIDLEIKPTAGMRLGVLTVVALGAGLAAVLIFLLTGGGREFFERTTTLTTFMPDGTGLAPGSEVRLSGIRVGEVSAVDMSGLLDPQRVVRVDMTLGTKYLRSIPSDSQTSLGADTLVGSRFVGIDEGKSPLPVPEGGMLKSEPVRPDAQQADLILSLQNELRQVDQILQGLTSGDNPIGHFLLGEDEYDKILSRITSFQQSLHAFVGVDSPVGKVLFSDVMYKSIRERVANIDSMLISIQKGEGTAGKLFATDEQYTRALTQLRSLHESLRKLAPTLRNEDLYRRAITLLRNTDRLILSMTVGESASARLLESAQLYESLHGSLRGMEELLRDLREHPQKYLRYQVFNRKK